MKLHLPVPLLALALMASCSVSSTASATETAFTTDLGNVMYVGDSITHGVNSASYRWALHKIFVDNGISYNAEGVKTGNYSGGVAAGTTYGGVAFNNLHSSQASARAWEIAGRKDGARFDDSNIQNWLGQSSTKNNGAAYTGATYTGEATPDTFFLLIGTNDLLSDTKNNTLPSQLSTIQANLLGDSAAGTTGDMDTILSSMKQANADAKVVVMTIPCWTTHSNNNVAATHQAVADYNTALTAWAAGKEEEGVILVDVNKGMLDVASSTPFSGCSSMFNAPGSDGLHPNAQGDLIMAGNLAKAMGYAGRTVGQARLGAEAFAINIQDHAASFALNNVTIDSGVIDLGAEGESSISFSWSETDDLTAGFTLDLGTVTLGDGSGEDGVWNTTQDLSVSLGAEKFYGTLNINEAYIKWGDTVLYSTDMSQNTESVRVSWLAGNSLEGVASGYYVWLGDMLIGEALGSTYESGHSGLSISYSGNVNAELTQLALTTGSYAPLSTGLADASNAFTSVGPLLPATKGEPQGKVTWVEGDSSTHTAADLSVSGTFNARAAADATPGAAGNVVSTPNPTRTTSHIYANRANYSGDVWLDITAEGKATSWFAAHGGSGTLTGNANLRISGTAQGGSTVFGAVNAAKVTGDVYVELSAEGATFGSFTNTAGQKASLVGSYQTNIDGNVDLVVNAGTLNSGIMGGIHTGAMTIGGKASVYVNGGSINGDVKGGGLTGTINGGTRVTVTNGTITGNVYGGGSGDTINAPTTRMRAAESPTSMPLASSVELTGGTINGDVYGGGSGSTINGNTGVTVVGSAVRLYDGSTWGNIDGGSASGTVAGDAIVTLKDVISTSDGYGFDKYAGTITGGSNVAGESTLVLDNMQISNFAATLQDIDTLIATNGTQTTLTSFGGAKTVSIGDGCSLTTTSVSDLSLLQMGENSALTIGGFSADSVIIDITGISNYSISTTVADISNIAFRKGDSLYFAELADVDLQANSGRLVLGAVAVPEPATATLSLLALAALAARRRRK